MKIFILILFFTYPMSLIAQNCNCLLNFDQAVANVRANYSGFEDKVKPANSAAFESFTFKLRQRASRVSTVKECAIILRTWTNYFKDAHLRVQLDWQFKEKYPEVSRSVSEYFAAQKVKPKTMIPLDDHTSIKMLDEHSVLLRLPSFEWSEKSKIDSLVTRYEKQLKESRFWIIDLRGNIGGTDYAFNSILPFIYDGPIIVKPDEYRSSPGNIMILKENSTSKDLTVEAMDFLKKLIAQMEANPNQFVNPYGVESTEIKLDSVYQHPTNVGILIDRNSASSVESFLLMATQSKKVTVFGENSAGMLDYSSAQFFNLPCKDLNLVIPIARSKRLPDHPIDNIGIAPNVRLNNKDSDPVATILKMMKKAASN